MASKDAVPHGREDKVDFLTSWWMEAKRGGKILLTWVSEIFCHFVVSGVNNQWNNATFFNSLLNYICKH